MTFSIIRPFALAALAFAAIGCDQGRTNPPDTTVRVVNVAPGFASVNFRREQSSGEELGFKVGAQATYDEDTYDFNVDTRNLVTGGSDLARTFTKQVQSGTLYTFVLAQVGTGIRELIVETQPPAANATDVQVVAAHAAEGIPPVDVFLERTGTDIAGAVPWGSVGFFETLAARSVAVGDYEVTLTAAGNRASVLYKSPSFALVAAESIVFVITPEAGESRAPLSLAVTASSGFVLPDQTTPAAVSVLNAAADLAPRDVAFNGQFNPPLFAAVPYGPPTAYVPITPAVDVPVQVTPPGNPGVFELDQKVSPLQTRRHTLLVYGDAGALAHLFTIDDKRRFFNEGRVRFFNAAKQFAGLDLVIVNATADPTTALAAVTLAPGGASAFASAAPGSYNIYLRLTGTTTLVAGPVALELASEGLYGVLASNGADTTTATIILFEEPQ